MFNNTNKEKGEGEIIAIIIILAIVVFIIWLTSPFTPTPEAKNTELQTTLAVQKDLVNAVPIPQLTNSLERENVAKRAELFNKSDKISYIYLVNYGKIMAYYSVKGKVSSLRSYMAPMQKLINNKGEDCSDWNATGSCYTVDAPDIDGTYGENVEGIFFFTTEGAYVEWHGDYMMSDQPLTLSTPPELVRSVK